MSHFKSNTELEIILELIKKECYGRELSKNAHVSQTTLRRMLKKLENNIIGSRIEGKNTIFFLKNSLLTKQYILMAEQYRLVKLLSKYSSLEPIISDIKKEFSGLIILFGSYAKGTAKENSDIDIYMYTSNLSLKKKVEFINSKISVKIGKLSNEDFLSKEIIENHVILSGLERFYEKFPIKT